jgi:hypothetical protein
MKNHTPLISMLVGLALWGGPSLFAQEDPYVIELEGEEEDPGLTQEQLEEMALRIVPRVAELRGLEWKHQVPVGINTPEQFREFAVEAVRKEMGEDRLRVLSTFSLLLGVLEPGQDYEETMYDMLEAGVGGYFDPETDKFYMISTFNQGGMAEFIMAHELGHALDHQYHDLIDIFELAKGNSDYEFATRCVVEGSASAVGNAYLFKGIQNGWIDPSEMMDMDMMGAMLEGMEDVPIFMIVNLSLPYLDGTTFMVRKTSKDLLAAMMMEPTEDDLLRAFTSPPTSSEQIFHPEKYWDEKTFDAPRTVTLADRSADLGEGWSLALTDTLGEFGCAMMTMKNLPTAMSVSMGAAAMVHESSSGWGGDTSQTYVHEDGSALMHWSTVWDSEKDAMEFSTAMREIGMKRAPLLRALVLQGDKVDAYFATDGAEALLEKLK